MKENIIIKNYKMQIKINKITRWVFLFLFEIIGIIFIIKIPQVFFIGIIFIFLGAGLFLLSIWGCNRIKKALNELEEALNKKTDLTN
jgi:CHASE3 domain sensor protein